MYRVCKWPSTVSATNVYLHLLIPPYIYLANTNTFSPSYIYLANTDTFSALFYLANTDTFSALYYLANTDTSLRSIIWRIQTPSPSLRSILSGEYRHILSALYYLANTDTFSLSYIYLANTDTFSPLYYLANTDTVTFPALFITWGIQTPSLLSILPG